MPVIYIDKRMICLNEGVRIFQYLLAFLFILVSCEAQARWVQIGENNRAVAYADTKPEKKGNSVIFWILYSYKETQKSPRSERRYLSEKAQYEINCATRKIRTLFFTWHSQRLGYGTVVYTGRKATPWEPATSPYSYANAFEKFYCEELRNNIIPTQKEVDKKIIEGFEIAAKKVNHIAPIMIDQNTRLDKVTVGPGARATYHYTYPKYSSKKIDSEWLQSNLRPVVIKNVCSNDKMKTALEYGGIYVFSYSGNDGIKITCFQISREDCGFAHITPRLK